MKTISLIFPHQLFKVHPAITENNEVYLVEEYLYFKQFAFHQQKMVLHRASMRFFENYLTNKGLKVNYIEAKETIADCRSLLKHLANKGIKAIHYVDTVDYWLEKRLRSTATKVGIELVTFPSPNFLNTPAEMNDFFAQKKTYFQKDFYVFQRKRRKILLDEKQAPMGGKWSFDTENRKKISKNVSIPRPSFPVENNFVQEAKLYVAKEFSTNYGSVKNIIDEKNISRFLYPTTYAEATTWLDQFLAQRFHQFGEYEDALLTNESILFHSMLTPMLNIGLLNPEEIIDKALSFAAMHNIPINSLEGFIRQIIGWREFIRLVYSREGSKQRTKNFWGVSRKIPATFWKGETGIPPLDVTIKKLLQTGYSHHIERLMVLGNFMLLCEFDPNEVYKWFMEMYVDAYDWVMVPNVYGMTQFADGGLMTTKPYISGSNYLMKMSDFEKGAWQEIWDALFWRFMHVHRSFFLKNPRLGMLVGSFDKMTEEKKNKHLQIANQYLASLDI